MVKLARKRLALAILIPALCADSPAFADMSADVELLEACVFETSLSHDPNQCIGLLSDGCEADIADPNACLKQEGRVWLEILKGTTADPNEFYPDVLDDAFDIASQCRRTSNAPNSCMRDTMANLAIPRLLALHTEITEPPDFEQLKDCTAYRERPYWECRAFARSICANEPDQEAMRQCTIQEQRLAITAMTTELVEQAEEDEPTKQFLRSFSLLAGMTIRSLCNDSAEAEHHEDRSLNYQTCFLIALATLAERLPEMITKHRTKLQSKLTLPPDPGRSGVESVRVSFF